MPSSLSTLLPPPPPFKLSKLAKPLWGFKDTNVRGVRKWLTKPCKYVMGSRSLGCDRGPNEIFLIPCFYRDSSTKFFVPGSPELATCLAPTSSLSSLYLPPVLSVSVALVSLMHFFSDIRESRVLIRNYCTIITRELDAQAPSAGSDHTSFISPRHVPVFQWVAPGPLATLSSITKCLSERCISESLCITALHCSTLATEPRQPNTRWSVVVKRKY